MFLTTYQLTTLYAQDSSVPSFHPPPPRVLRPKTSDGIFKTKLYKGLQSFSFSICCAVLYLLEWAIYRYMCQYIWLHVSLTSVGKGLSMSRHSLKENIETISEVDQPKHAMTLLQAMEQLQDDYEHQRLNLNTTLISPHEKVKRVIFYLMFSLFINKSTACLWQKLKSKSRPSSSLLNQSSTSLSSSSSSRHLSDSKYSQLEPPSVRNSRLIGSPPRNDLLQSDGEDPENNKGIICKYPSVL